MSAKFEIIGNNLVVTDTDSSAVVFDEVASYCTYSSVMLDKGTIRVTYPIISNKNSTSFFFQELISNSIDGEGNTFTADTFRDFARVNLGGSGVIGNLDGIGNLDAGGRQRVSQINSLIDIKQFNDNAPLFYDRENIGGATQSWSKAVGGTTMSVSASGDAAISQSYMFAPYFSGKSQLGEITFANMQNETDVTKRVGYFSSNTTTPWDSNKDGLWLEADGTNHRFIIQKNGIEVFNELVTTSNDLSKFNVFVFQFLYLGGTAIRFGFVEDGIIKLRSKHIHAGVVDLPFVESPNQPIRYEIRSTGGSGSLDQICAQIASEGSIGEIGVSRAFSVDNVQANAIGTAYATIGVRLKSDYRNIRIDKEAINLVAGTNDDFHWYLCLNPTVSGTFTYNDVTNSAVQLATSTTATVTDLGTILDGGFGTGDASISQALKNQLRPGSAIDGTMDELVLAIEPISSTNLDVWCSMTINEL